MKLTFCLLLIVKKFSTHIFCIVVDLNITTKYFSNENSAGINIKKILAVKEFQVKCQVV